MTRRAPQNKARRPKRPTYNPADKFTQPEAAVRHVPFAAVVANLPDQDLDALPDAPDTDKSGQD